MKRTTSPILEKIINLENEKGIQISASESNIEHFILRNVDKSPGIRYRELLRSTGFTNGRLEYHLKIIEKTNKLKVERKDGRRTRFYPINISDNESHIIAYVRNEVTRNIAVFILQHTLCRFSQIVEHIKKAPSTVSWHLKRLTDSGIISITHRRDYNLYSVVNNKLMKEVLYKYEASFNDKIATTYSEIVEEL